MLLNVPPLMAMVPLRVNCTSPNVPSVMFSVAPEATTHSPACLEPPLTVTEAPSNTVRPYTMPLLMVAVPLFTSQTSPPSGDSTPLSSTNMPISPLWMSSAPAMNMRFEILP